MKSKKIAINEKASSKNGIYGLPYKEKESKVIYIPIPWDVTTSYRAGTSQGPMAILKASSQIDFFDLQYKDAFLVGLFLKKESKEILEMNKKGRKLALTIIESEGDLSKTQIKNQIEVNKLSHKLNEKIYKETKKYLEENKIPVIVGGDHSTPFGAIKAYSEKYKNLGILHFDAHSDTRVSYMGFQDSHASIMYNVMEKTNVKKLVQVGIRDFCEQEYDYTKKNKKVEVYFDQVIATRIRKGETFSKIAKEIVSKLPNEIYISFDIDGLDPKYCPHTGTPVPGGLEFNDILMILDEIIKSKKTIVGFDLVEVTPDLKNKENEWDANVGMRLLYKMTSAMLTSLKLCPKRS